MTDATPTPDHAELPQRLLALVYALVFGFALLPLLCVEILPISDLPNHMARAYIFDHLDRDADLAKYYWVQWRLLSFQSIDIILPPLAKITGLTAAARLYVIATFAALLGGTIALHRALYGRVGFWPAVAALFLFNFALAWGFVAYLFAAGLVLLMVAAWIASERRRGIWLLLAFTIAPVALLLCHAFAFSVYAVILAGYEAQRFWRGTAPLRQRVTDAAIAAATLVPAAVLALLAVDTSVATISQPWTFFDLARGFISPTIMYMEWPDFVVTYATLIALWVLIRRRLLRFDPRMLLPTAVLLLFAVVMPPSIASVWGATMRIPCLLAFLVVAASDLRLRDPRRLRFFALGVVLLLALRSLTLVVTWRAYNADIAGFRMAAAQIERGARVLSTPFPENYISRRNPAIFPLLHAGSFAVIDRDVFLPTLFTFATPLRFAVNRRVLTDNAVLGVQHAIAWTPGSAAFASADDATRAAASAVGERGFLNNSYMSAVDWSRWPEDFDYLIDYHFDPRSNPVPALLTEVGSGSFFTIYRIHPPAAKATVP